MKTAVHAGLLLTAKRLYVALLKVAIHMLKPVKASTSTVSQMVRLLFLHYRLSQQQKSQTKSTTYGYQLVVF